jgi:hypothetical protein
MVGCTAVSEPIRVSWTSVGLNDGSDAQEVITFEMEPSLQPMLVAFSARGRC